MSVLIASGELVSNSQVNTSGSKQMFSFPKTARFVLKPAVNQNVAYEAGTSFKTLTYRSLGREGAPGSSFGFGARPQLWDSKEKNSKPGPCYLLNSAFKSRKYAEPSKSSSTVRTSKRKRE